MKWQSWNRWAKARVRGSDEEAGLPRSRLRCITLKSIDLTSTASRKYGGSPNLDYPDRIRADSMSFPYPAAGTPPEELLRWASTQFGSRFAISTAFQKEGMVLLDMAARLDRGIRVLTLDTGRLPDETYTIIEAVRAIPGVTAVGLSSRVGGTCQAQFPGAALPPPSFGLRPLLRPPLCRGLPIDRVHAARNRP